MMTDVKILDVTRRSETPDLSCMLSPGRSLETESRDPGGYSYAPDVELEQDEPVAADAGRRRLVIRKT